MPVILCNLSRSLETQLENFFNSFPMETGYRVMAAMVIPIVILTSIYFVWGRKPAWKGKKKPDVYTRSMSLGALHGGDLALERLIDYHRARADASAHDEAVNELKELLAAKHPDFRKLQRTAAKLEMSGRETVAAEILQRKLREVVKEGKSHEAYEISMLLTEMYIYQGKWDKASNCECLKHEEISDARRPLYKAIIKIMSENQVEPKKKKNHVEAKKLWDEFKNKRALFLSPGNYRDRDIQKLVEQFEEFEKVVTSLQRDTV